MPLEDPYGAPPTFPPPSYGYDLYRGAGGLDLGEMLQQQRAQQQAQQFNLQQAEAAAQARAQAEAEQAQRAQWDTSQQQFVDWPTFQKDAAGTEPGRMYDGYLEALDWQLQQMGYPPGDAKYIVEQFQKLVPRPPEDKGFLQNLFSSATSGAESGSDAIRAAGAAARGDNAELARLGAASAAPAVNAPLGNFQAAIGAPPGVDPKDYGEAAKRIFDAGFTSWAGVEGMLNFFVQQTAQSSSVIAGGIAGGAAGTAVLPGIGTAIGAAAGMVGPDFALDAGSTMLQNLVEEAQDRGIDPTDQKALLELLQIPEVRDRIISDGVAHGLPVAGVDAAMSAVTAGAGGFISRLLRSGRKLRATAVGAGTAIADIGAGPLGERWGQGETSKGFTSAGDVIVEGFGQAGPAVASGAIGFAGDRVRSLQRPGVLPAPPGAPVEPTLGGLPSEEDLAGFRNEPTLSPQEIVTQAENRLLPVVAGPLATIPQTPTLAATPEGVVGTQEQIDAQREQQRLAALAPQPADFNIDDAMSLADRMVQRGISVNTNEMHDALETVAGAPTTDKQAAIASVIEELVDSHNPNAEPMALELIRIAHELKPDKPATPAQIKAALAQVAQELGTTPDQVMPVVAQAAAQEIADAITTTHATPTQTAEAPTQTKRSLRRGEQLPATDLGSLAAQLLPGGPVQGQGRAQAVQGQPRRSLRAGRGTQGDVALGGQQRGVGSANQGGVGTLPVAPERVSPNAPERGIRKVDRTTKAIDDITELDFTDLDAIEAEKLYEELYPGRSLRDDEDDILSAEKRDPC